MFDRTGDEVAEFKLSAFFCPYKIEVLISTTRYESYRPSNPVGFKLRISTRLLTPTDS